jgi:hypothetical protein
MKYIIAILILGTIFKLSAPCVIDNSSTNLKEALFYLLWYF